MSLLKSSWVRFALKHMLCMKAFKILQDVLYVIKKFGAKSKLSSPGQLIWED